MSDINELEGRITAALDRIAKGLDGLPKGGAGDEEEINRLTHALEEERTVSAQLEERVRGIKDKLDHKIEELDQLQKAAARIDAELQQLRDVNQQLRDSNVALRDANAAGLADPELINASLMAELESFRAGRVADAAEMGAVLTQLDMILAADDTQEDA